MGSIFTPVSVLANQMKTQTAATFMQLTNLVNQKLALFWNNPNPAMTPDAIAAALGIDAAQEIAALEATITLLNSLQPGTIAFTPPRAITVNADGTITLARAA